MHINISINELNDKIYTFSKTIKLVLNLETGYCCCQMHDNHSSEP